MRASLLALTICFVSFPAQAEYGGGTGEPSDPYLIYTAEQMNAIGANPNDWQEHFKLMADIDLSAFDGKEGRPAFNIIGTRYDNGFSGVFDGNGHIISNFSYTSEDRDYVGLFGYIGGAGAEIKNLGLVDPNVTAGKGESVGSLVGGVGDGTIDACYVRGGSIIGNRYVGGLLGYSSGNVTHCYSTTVVSGTEYAGGLVGFSPFGVISQCYSTGAVSGMDWCVGGLVGGSWFGTVTASFWNIQTSGQTTSAGGTGKTTAEMQAASTFLHAGWDFVGETENGMQNVWWILEGEDYPRLSWELAEPEGPEYGGGTGSLEDPYLIYTAEQMNIIGYVPNDWDSHFRLMADIDLSAFDGKAGRPAFNIIAPDADGVKGDFKGSPFTGVFDGNGHTISHLTIMGQNYLGLFGKLASGAEVRNLGVVDVNITGSWDCVGAIVGHNLGVVTRSYSTGVVSSGAYSYSVGGLAGSNQGAVTCCYSAAAVSGRGSIGGLVGNNSGAAIQCYSTGAVSGKYIGGLVGDNSGAVIACFWDTQTSGQATSAGGTGLTTAAMYDISTYLGRGWDFVAGTEDKSCKIWQMPEDGGYPLLVIFNGYTPPQLRGLGTPENPYLIFDALDLRAMVYHSPYAQYRLAASIDLSGIRWDTAVIPWFAGAFDGNHLVISHLMIEGDEYLGLFGRLVTGAEVKDLGVLDVNMVGSGDFVGGLVGDLAGGAITACYVVDGYVSGGSNIGGVAGYKSSGDVIDCYSTAAVTGAANHIGGLLGCNYSGAVTGSYSAGAVSGSSYVGGLMGTNCGDVARCYSAGSVSGNSYVGGLVAENDHGTLNRCFSTAAVNGDSEVGGLVGVAWFGVVSDCNSSGAVDGNWRVGGLVGRNTLGAVIRCCNTGAISGGAQVGGVVGDNDGTVSNCYNTGSVSGEFAVGGLVGHHQSGIVGNCYSSGAVSGTDWDVGGLVGGSWGGTVTASFWNTQTSGQTTSAGGTGKTTAQMQNPATFMEAGWDFVRQPDGPHDIWAAPAGGGYPILSWQLAPGYGLPTFSGGTGEPGDPYCIATVTELNSIGHNPRLMAADFMLVNDIDLTGVNFYIIGSELSPFIGVFDGNGRTISHLTIKGMGSLGLFGQLGAGAQVRDLGLVDLIITGSGDFVGGLVAHNSGDVTNCYSTGAVSGGGCVGALVGTNYNDGTVTNCYSAGAVRGTGLDVGGLVGGNSGAVTYCYSTGAVSGSWFVGGVVGSSWFGTVTASFWDVQASGQTGSAGGTGKTTAGMQMASTFLEAGWDFVGETANGTEDIWWILEAKDYPRLSWELAGQ